jgi:uncharacterized Fe-S cluster protein YjdI
MTREYTNGETTVVWDEPKCIHSANCIRGLPKVFNPARRPWINLEGTPTAAIIETVGRCPSGALTIKPVATPAPPAVEITLAADGPLLIRGVATLTDEAGTSVVKEGAFALCRCGASANKPYCDGSHRRTEFKTTPR